jgi:sugar phosphate isomerase/epimerase
MHPRACVSAISTFKLPLDEDLAFWDRHGITTVGVSVAKLERFGWPEGTQLVADAVGRGLRVANLIGLGPFHLANPASWPRQQERLVRSVETAAAVDAECMVFTTGPFAPLTWEEAADALAAALTPILSEAANRGVPFAIEHTNSLRVDVGFVHTLRTRSTWRAASTSACAWSSTRAGPSEASTKPFARESTASGSCR